MPESDEFLVIGPMDRLAIPSMRTNQMIAGTGGRCGCCRLLLFTEGLLVLKRQTYG
jgi:hypothetical protein